VPPAKDLHARLLLREKVNLAAQLLQRDAAGGVGPPPELQPFGLDDGGLRMGW